MKQPYAPALRIALRKHPDGLTIKQLLELVGAQKDGVIRNALHAMPDVYIDRWIDPKRGQYQAVYCVVVPPNNCPYPTEREQFAQTEWRFSRSEAREKLIKLGYGNKQETA